MDTAATQQKRSSNISSTDTTATAATCEFIALRLHHASKLHKLRLTLLLNLQHSNQVVNIGLCDVCVGSIVASSNRSSSTVACLGIIEVLSSECVHVWWVTWVVKEAEVEGCGGER